MSHGHVPVKGNQITNSRVVSELVNHQHRQTPNLISTQILLSLLKAAGKEVQHCRPLGWNLDSSTRQRCDLEQGV